MTVQATDSLGVPEITPARVALVVDTVPPVVSASIVTASPSLNDTMQAELTCTGEEVVAVGDGPCLSS